MAIIPHTAEEGKVASRDGKNLLLPLIILLLACSASFGLGILAGKDMAPKGEGVKIETLAGAAALSGGTLATPPPIPHVKSSAHKSSSSGYKKPEKQGTATKETGKYVASKNGTKYYLPACGSAARIKEENKIYFMTKEEAEAAGYSPSSTCKGL